MTIISKTWAATIEEAQEQTTQTICGAEHLRIKYGDDYPDGKTQCRDCGVAHGQLHVPGCCVERCPRCDGQAISCQCNDDEAEERAHLQH